MNKDSIKELLMSEFSSVYCDTCCGDEDRCDKCHRKSMMWALSEESASEITNKIMLLVDDYVEDREFNAMFDQRLLT